MAVIIFTALLGGALQNSFAGETFITVYNKDLALVKQNRLVDTHRQNLPLKITDVAARLIPTSVHLRPLKDGQHFAVLEQNFEYDLVSADKILQKYIDHPIEIINDKGELLNGTLLSKSGDNLVLKTESGLKIVPWNDKMTVNVEQLPQGLITRPTLIWEVAGVGGEKTELELSYLTRGMSWHAEYVGVLNEAAARLDLGAWVSLDNRSGATFRDAHLKLVAGDIHRAPQEKQVRRFMRVESVQTASAPPPGFEERKFFEYHIYELERKTTIKDKQTKQISLFPNATVRCEKKFYYNWQQDTKKISVKILFTNDKKSGLGKPLPAGIVRLYQKDQQNLEFIGEDRIDHTPHDEDVKIAMGNAFDLTAERRVVDRKKLSKKSQQEKLEIELRNRKEKDDVNIIVEEHIPGINWKIEKNNFPYTKKTANTIEFNVPVKAKSKTTVQYTVTYSW